MSQSVTDTQGSGAEEKGRGQSRPSMTSPKRSNSERRGLHAWHPYYAGFSEGFVTDILSELGIGPDRLVLDPMNGGGTTTMVAQQRGCLAVGNELNPAMAIMARAKDQTLSNRADLEDLAREVVRRARRHSFDGKVNKHVASWIPPTAFADLKRLQAELCVTPEP